MPRTEREDNDDLVQYIEARGNRIEKAIKVPTPEGRTQGGWVTVQSLKVPQDMMTQAEQLREHQAFKGNWKTNTQVLWSLIYLGLYNMHEYLTDGGGDTFKAAHRAMNAANELHAERMQQEQLMESAKLFRRHINDSIKKGTAFGTYAAWKALHKAIEARDSVEDVQSFDKLMKTGQPSLETALLFDRAAADLWERLFPTSGGDLDQAAFDDIYITMTQPYFDELDAIRKAQEDEEA